VKRGIAPNTGPSVCRWRRRIRGDWIPLSTDRLDLDARRRSEPGHDHGATQPRGRRIVAVDVGVVLDPERAICARRLHRFEVPTQSLVSATRSSLQWAPCIASLSEFERRRFRCNVGYTWVTDGQFWTDWCEFRAVSTRRDGRVVDGGGLEKRIGLRAKFANFPVESARRAR
jgi:hypothetical protein